MRKIYDVNGTDVTSTVLASLQAGNSFVFAKLFRFLVMNFWDYNPYGQYENFTFTDAGFPIFINQYQAFASGVSQLGTWTGGAMNADGLMFIPETMNCGTLEYAVGFEDHPVDVTWPMDDTKKYESGICMPNALNPPNLTLKTAFALGAFSECPFWIHQAIFDNFPSQGGSLLGTTLLFRGYIRTATVTRTSLKLGIASLMDVFQQIQVPTQTITPNDRSVPYAPAAAGEPGGTNIDLVTVLSLTSLNLHSNFGSFSLAKDALKDNWMTFQPAIISYPRDLLPGPGLPPPPMWRIRGNDASSTGDLVVYFYEPPIVPANTLSPLINWFGQAPLGGTSAPGFPFVPPPEVSTP
jgi:hypothetical protein